MRYDVDARYLPSHWYSIIGDLPFELPEDIPASLADGQRSAVKMQLPLSLMR